MIVTGPTGSGKSGLALALAEALEATIINADALQVYRELAILTARPGPEACRRVPHRLYGVIPAAEACSAGRWRSLAIAEIEAALAAGRLPLLVGGTGLYLKALREGLSPVPAVPAAVRARARLYQAELGATRFHAKLARRDPVMAARIAPGDSHRALRAWEVLEASGRSLAHWQDAAQESSPYRFFQVALVPPRPLLAEVCERRFRDMLAAGALEEVRALRQLGLDPALPAMKAIGLSELGAYLDGRLALEAAIEQAVAATRRYAKRQVTWLRTQGPPPGPEAITLDAQYSESLDKEIFAKIRVFLLTAAEAGD